MKVQSLFYYPLKSARAVPTGNIEVTVWGLDGDRRFMLVDEVGKFITQRELPALAMISARGDADGISLSHADGRSIRINFDEKTRIDVEIWGQVVSTAVAGDHDNEALSGWFGRNVRIVHADALTERSCNVDLAGEGVTTGLSDGYPILVTTTGSLAALNDYTRNAGGLTFGMDRFRPNIVFDEKVPFLEDSWARIAIGDVELDLVKPCPRCIMTTQDQLTGERDGPDPMPAMRALRMSADRRVPGVLFGWNAVPRSLGEITVGSDVSIVSSRPEGWAFRMSDRRRDRS